jgi:hypothetical protein
VNTIAADRSPLELGVLAALAGFAIAGALGLVAVLDADGAGSAFGTGFGLAWAIALAGSAVAAALACLKRGRLEIVALGTVVAVGLALDLLVLAILADIDSEAYGRVTGVLFSWSFFALVLLGLTIAAGAGVAASFGRLLYLATIAVTVLAGLISTWLIATAGDDSSSDSDDAVFYPVDIGDDELLRVLGACLVVIAALWFATLAATRVPRAPRSDVEAHV